MDDWFDPNPKVPGVRSLSVQYLDNAQRWFFNAVTVRQDRVTFDVAGPFDELTYKGCVGILRAYVLSLNAIGAAIDDSHDDKDTVQ